MSELKYLTTIVCRTLITEPDSDVLTESDFNLFDADHTSQDAL